MIDPVDLRRIVAAAVSRTGWRSSWIFCPGHLSNHLPHRSSDFEHPSITQDELAAILDRRGTSLYAITFATPPYIEEIVVSQLKRSTSAIAEYLERNGALVHHAHYRMGDKECMILVELLVSDLPPIQTHLGPPAWNR